MPRRWNKDRPDYSRLYEKDRAFVLDAAIQNPNFGTYDQKYPARANEDLIHLFAGRELLTVSDLIEEAESVRKPLSWSGEFACDVIGNTVGWGLKLGLVERLGAVPETSYRLLEREPVFLVVAGKNVRVRGLPPDQQIVMNVRLSKLMRLRATLDAKRDEKVGAEAAGYIGRLIAADAAASIPDRILQFFDGHTTRLAEGLEMRDARTLLGQAHIGMLPRWRKPWLETLRLHAEAAEKRGRLFDEERIRAANLAEDADASADL